MWAAFRVEQTRSGGIVAVTLAFLGTASHGGACGPSGPLSSRKRPELPRMPSTPRITTFPPVPVTCDAVRTKCREMLTAALQTDRECFGWGHPAHLRVLAPDTTLHSQAWALPAVPPGAAPPAVTSVSSTLPSRSLESRPGSVQSSRPHASTSLLPPPSPPPCAPVTASCGVPSVTP